MGAFHQVIDKAQQVGANPPQTGANPNPPAVSYGSQPAGKGAPPSALPQYGSPNTTQPAGKGGMSAAQPATPAAKGGSNVTYPSQSGQPQMGVPNKYANTVQPIDNTNIQPGMGAMKGKGS